MDQHHQNSNSFISLILEACNSAKNLESNLPSLANNPEMLAHSIDVVITSFAAAKHRLLNVHHQIHHPPAAAAIDDHHLLLAPPAPAKASSSSSSQRPRTSKKGDDDDDAAAADHGKRTVVRLPAPLMGNTELPPDDCYTWRKYGQKEILGSMYPRAYYRCTHQKMYNCQAKKQVQRLDDDPYMFQVTYIGDHTCHMSATAPSNPPPPSTQTQTPSMSLMFPMERLISSSSLGGGGGGGGAGPSSSSGLLGHNYSSSSRGGGEQVDYPAVADLADQMFNSGSSSSNSMEFIFPCVQDKKN